MRASQLSCCLVALLLGCGPAAPADESEPGSAETAALAGAEHGSEGGTTAEPGSPLDEMRTAVAALAARKEHGSNFVQVQHVLIGVKGAPRMQVERSLAEAEQLAAEIFRQAQDGTPFRQLLVQSEDSGGSEYRILKAQRSTYVKGFGDVAWRLYPGEIGVCPYDPEDSPFGFHIIRRIL